MATAQSRRQPSAGGRRRKQPLEGSSAPSTDEIRLLAYEIYEHRCAGGLDGDADGDWIEAERRLSNGGGRPAGAAKDN